MTTLFDLEARVRRGLRESPRYRKDVMSGDGTSTVFDLGKTVGVQSYSETVTISGSAKVRGVDYTMGPAFGYTDYGAFQITFLTAPASATDNINVAYRETPYPSEYIWDALNSGRVMLYPKFYKRSSATFTVANNQRDYNLATEVSEAYMRGVFSAGFGTWMRLRCTYQPYGSSTQELWVSFRKYWMEYRDGAPYIHLWWLLGVNDVVRLDVAHAFTPLVTPDQVTDIPDHLQELVILWALSQLMLKLEPQRLRIDTANVLQSVSANPYAAIPQSANDFASRFWLMFNRLPSMPPTIEISDMPLPFESGLNTY